MAALAGFKTDPCDERFLKAYQANSPVAPLVCAWSALGLRLVCAITLCVHCHWSALGLRLVCGWSAPMSCVYTAIGLRLVCAWSAVGLRNSLCIHCHWSALDLRLVCGWSAPLSFVYTVIGLRLVCWNAWFVLARLFGTDFVFVCFLSNICFAAPFTVLWLLWRLENWTP